MACPAAFPARAAARKNLVLYLTVVLKARNRAKIAVYFTENALCETRDLKLTMSALTIAGPYAMGTVL
jgi:hypothetical protein